MHSDQIISVYEATAQSIQASSEFQYFNQVMEESMNFIVEQSMTQFHSKYSHLLGNAEERLVFHMVITRCVGNGMLLYSTLAKSLGIILRQSPYGLNDLIMKFQQLDVRKQYDVEDAFTTVSLGAMVSLLGKDERIIQIQHLARGAVATSFLFSLIACEY